jgi:glycosyltransferase involved in cell wall biosynthesis
MSSDDTPPPALDLCSVPKAFHGAIARIQENAWRSWKQLPGCSIHIFGKEEGVAAQAQRHGFGHSPESLVNEHGTPTLDGVLNFWNREEANRLVGFVNSDIILLPRLATVFNDAVRQHERLLIVSRRWNLDVPGMLETSPGWDQRLHNRAISEGELFSEYGIDLFIMTRRLFQRLPPFAVGRDYWDNHMVMAARRGGAAVIDITELGVVVHQNHELPQFDSAAKRRLSPESRRNFSFCGDSYGSLGRTTDATHRWRDGKIVPTETYPIEVVIPYWGRLSQLSRCLNALEHQTYPRSFIKTLVVNNNPEMPLRHLELDYPNLRVIREERKGPAAARNKGLSVSDTEYVALLDSDTVPRSRCFEEAMKAFEADADLDIVVFHIEPAFRSKGASFFGRCVEWFDAVTHYNQEKFIRYSGAFATTGLLARKRIFSGGAYFNEMFPEAASEDWFWSKNLIASGAKVAFCAEAVIKHPTARTLLELKLKRERYARGDCIFKTLANNETFYSGRRIWADEWKELRERSRQAWRDRRLPGRFRPGYAVLAVICFLFALRMKFAYRSHAFEVVQTSRLSVES